MEEGPMKKSCLFIVIIGFLVLSLAGVSYGWQGRMAGMGDPYGLIADESDYLIHPAKIAKGEGIKFYGDYRLTYTGVTKWDYTLDSYDAAGVWNRTYWDDFSGDEQKHNALLGASFPLGPGRMGFFFNYDGMRGDYDGYHTSTGGGYEKLGMKSALDAFAFKLLYGLPIGGFKLGGEVHIAYRQDKKETNEYTPAAAWLNEYWQFLNIYMYPYKSKYWEALFKGSLDGKVGPLDLEFTLRGGIDFSGTNKWYFEYQSPVGIPDSGFNMKGGVQGWRIGGDLWLRYPLAKDLSLPFLVRADYQDKTRDGDGPGWGGSAGTNYDYKHKERNLVITVGGGVDKAFSKDTRVAAGIYYNYLQRKENFSLNAIFPRGWDMSDDTYPDSVEHQILLRLAGERTISPAVALRAGLSFFYGWVNPKEKHTTIDDTGNIYISEGSGNGSPHWGIGASVGGTVKVKPLTLEPFVSGGYQHLFMKGDGERFVNSGLVGLYDAKLTRSEWFIGGGLSILFNLP
jgi:hypothetical protein